MSIQQYLNRALELHQKYGSNESIVRHCEAVARVALVLVETLKRKGKQGVDESSVITAALLHDIGRSRIQTVKHGYVGAEIAEKEGLGRAVSEMIRRHVGAGISKEEAAKLGFPDGDYVPRTLQERIVCFSDKMVDGDRVRPFEEEARRFVSKGHDVQRLYALRESLREDLGEDPERAILSRSSERDLDIR